MYLTIPEVSVYVFKSKPPNYSEREATEILTGLINEKRHLVKLEILFVLARFL